MSRRSRSACAKAPPPAPPARGRGTRERLLRAAEKLFAERGVAATSTRAILREAGQRNESALQYHFGGREQLLEALYVQRGAEVAAQRARMEAELESAEGELTVRSLCEIALLPAVDLARRDPSFRRFLEVVGQLAFLPSERLEEAHQRYELGGVARIRDRLRLLLELDPELLDGRVEIVHRIAAVSLAQRARTDGRFEGPDADLYFDSVLDAMAAVLTAPESRETRASLDAVRREQESATT